MENKKGFKIDPRGGSNRCNFKADFFQKWSSEMAYTLGFLYADGNITDATNSSRTQYIGFTSKDQDIISDIREILGSEHNIYRREPEWRRYVDGKTYQSSESFHLRIGSKRMFSDLLKIGLIPNKSKTIEFPKIPKKYVSHFVRGYFDGDGCIYIRKPYKGLRLIFTSGSKQFLNDLNMTIGLSIDLGLKRVYPSHRAYQLGYSTLDSIKLFKFLYKNAPKRTYLRRKVKIFSDYFQKKPLKVDRNIKKILNDLNMARYPSS